MFGLGVDEITIQPVEIDGDVYVPVHIEQGGATVSAYRRYDIVEDEVFVDSDESDTSDFRYDP